MNITKRLLAVVLSVCMVCAFIVPVAFAEKIDITITSGAHSGSNLPVGTVLNDGSTTGVGMKYLGYSGTRFNNTTYVTVSANGSLIVPLKRTGTAYDVCAGWVALELTNVPAGNYTFSWWSVQNSANGKAEEKGMYDVYVSPTFDYSEMDATAIAAQIDEILAQKTTDDRAQSFDFSANTASNDKVVNFAVDGDYIVVAKFVAKGASNTHASRSYFSAQHLYLNATDAEADIIVKPMSDSVTYTVGVTGLSNPALGTTISAANAPILNYLGWDAGRLISGQSVTTTAQGDLNVPLQVQDQNGDGAYDALDFGDQWAAVELKGISAGKYTVDLSQVGPATASDKKNYAKVNVYAIPSFDYSGMDQAALRAAINAALGSTEAFCAYDCSSKTNSDQKVVEFAEDGDYIFVLLTAERGVSNTVAARNYVIFSSIALNATADEADVVIGATVTPPETEPEPEEVIVGKTSAYKITNVDANVVAAFKNQIGTASANQYLNYLTYSGALWSTAKPEIINKNATDDLNVPFHQSGIGSSWVALEVTNLAKGNYTIGFWSSGGTSDKTGAGLFDIYAIESFDYSTMDEAAFQSAVDTALETAQKIATYDFSKNTGTSEVIRFANDANYIIVAKLVAVGEANTHSARAYFRSQGIWLTGSEEAHTVKVGVEDMSIVSVGGTKYEDVDEAVVAINGAASGTTIQLKQDFDASGKTITVNAGVVLDLKGKILTAAELNSAGAVIDTVGGGLVAADAFFAGNNNGYLPMTTAGGYALCQIWGSGVGSVAGDETSSFLFSAQMNNYSYVPGGITFKAVCTWSDGTVTAVAPSAFVVTWANTMKSQPESKIRLNVKGLDENVVDFAIELIVEANNVVINLGSVAL